MRRKKTDYTGHYHPVKIGSTSLSQSSTKHSTHSHKPGSESIGAIVSHSRSHTMELNQYSFNLVGSAIFLVISQTSNKIKAISQVREIWIGSAINGQFKLKDEIFLSKKKPDATIWDIAEMLTVEVETLIGQLKSFASTHQQKSDPDSDRYKPEFKVLSIPTVGKVKIRK